VVRVQERGAPKGVLLRSFPTQQNHLGGPSHVATDGYACVGAVCVCGWWWGALDTQFACLGALDRYSYCSNCSMRTDQDRAGLDTPEQLAELEANYSRVLLEARGGVGLGWKHSRTALAAAVVLPLALLAAATASRVWYLKVCVCVLRPVFVRAVLGSMAMLKKCASLCHPHWHAPTHQTYHPELLFPSKERKQRRRQQSKYRAPKARGKLNQVCCVGVSAHRAQSG
jgi:hypothetical protein